jgi:hypothetical protein
MAIKYKSKANTAPNPIGTRFIEESGNVLTVIEIINPMSYTFIYKCKDDSGHIYTIESWMLYLFEIIKPQSTRGE